MRFSQYDLIQTPDGIVSLVLGQYNSNLVVHPKYVPSETKTPWQFLGQSWNRVANPLAPTRTNVCNRSQFLKPYGEQDYLCEPTDSIHHFSAIETAQKLTRDGSPNLHFDRIQRFLRALAPIVPSNMLGVTGGVALGFGTEGFSDIDLVVGQEVYHAFAARIEKIPGVRLRTKAEWTTIYTEYAIVSNVTADEFARQMLRKRTQFTYEGVPTSVFIAPANLPELAPYSQDSRAQTLEGIVIDDSDAALLPARYTMRCGNTTIQLQSRDRAAIELARVGERVRARGIMFPNPHSILIRPCTTDALEVMQ